MIIPVRCFTCGSVMGNKWDEYSRLIASGMEPGAALEQLGVRRFCCRRMLLTHVDLIDRMLQFSCATTAEPESDGDDGDA
jgi:DNA-directed RNA polymerase I, II, and III subunit RPABC5